MYADDTSLTYASADLKLINDCVNDDLNKVYTAISRKVVAKTVHAKIPKGNMGYVQYTCF